MTFQADQTVYLPDGREAQYVMQNGHQHLVRVIREVDDAETGPYNYPDDKITPALNVYASAPVEVYDARILALREQESGLLREIAARQQEARDIARNQAAMEKAASKYPCIQQALDFIEGRITHVVCHDYDGAKIQTLKEAFEDVDTWGGRRDFKGMKLLNLFGTDKNGRNVAWALNRYRDGSGGVTKQIWPAQSEEQARQIVSKLLDEAIDAWRSGEANLSVGHPSIPETLKNNPWLAAPDEWVEAQKKREAEAKTAKIAKLREELAALESAP